MICLGIDSSSVAGSAAVIKDGVLIAESFCNIGLTHSETLAPTVDNVMKSAGVSIKDIDLIAVTVGPGSFTGIRIGVALAKGLAFPNSTPVIGVLSTDALAYPHSSFPGLVVSAIDARRGRVFYNIYKEGSPVDETGIIDIELLADKLGSERALLVGDGASLCYNQLKENCSVSLANGMLMNIRASAVAEIAVSRFEAGESVPATELRPVYIQMSQAERTLKEKLSTNQ